MKIELNEQNIRDYGIDKITGNSMESLLKRVEEAAENDFVIYFDVPDRVQSLNINIFDVTENEPTPPTERIVHVEQLDNVREIEAGEGDEL